MPAGHTSSICTLEETRTHKSFACRTKASKTTHTPDIGQVSPHSPIHRARAAGGYGSTLGGTFGCLLRPRKARAINYKTHFFQSTQLSIIRASLLGKPGLPLQGKGKDAAAFPRSASSVGHQPRSQWARSPGRALPKCQHSLEARAQALPKIWRAHPWKIMSLTQLSKRTLCA